MFCECRNLCVRYGSRTVLDIERLELPAGKITGIVGPNGSGKTTLLTVLSLLRRPTSGTVRLWGRDAGGGARALRGDVVFVLHPGYLFRGSVAHNLLYGLRARGLRRPEAMRRLAEALRMVAMSDFAHRSVADLSAGERQRVNVARALAIRPRAILLDEPTANVDTTTVEILAEVLRNLCDEHDTTIVHTSPAGRRFADITPLVVELDAGHVRHYDEGKTVTSNQ